jgi:UDP-2,4-diacetamido-2,4,6-trideoxy-beta-L-altropyranose hydrolase
MENEPEPALACRPVEDRDCRSLWAWANDPAARRASFHPALITWEEHLEWFRRSRGNPRCRMFIITNRRGIPVGVVRFNRRDDGRVIVSITISQQERGKGYGAQALRLALREFFRAGHLEPVIAEVKAWNTVSLKAFRAAGFICRGRRELDGEPVYLLEYGNPGGTTGVGPR